MNPWFSPPSAQWCVCVYVCRNLGTSRSQACCAIEYWLVWCHRKKVRLTQVKIKLIALTDREREASRRDAGRGKRKRGNWAPIAAEKAKRLQQDVLIHPFLIHLSSILSSLHSFLLHPPPQPSTLQRAALMSNITQATRGARALIITERGRVRKSDDPVSQGSCKRKEKRQKKKGIRRIKHHLTNIYNEVGGWGWWWGKREKDETQLVQCASLRRIPLCLSSTAADSWHRSSQAHGPCQSNAERLQALVFCLHLINILPVTAISVGVSKMAGLLCVVRLTRVLASFPACWNGTERHAVYKLQ